MQKKDCYVAITYDAILRELVYSWFYIKVETNTNPSIYYYSSQRSNLLEFQKDIYFTAFKDAIISSGTYNHMYIGSEVESEDFRVLHLLNVISKDKHSQQDGSELILSKFTEEESNEFKKRCGIIPDKDFFYGIWYTESSGASDSKIISIPILLVAWENFNERKDSSMLTRLLVDFLGKNQTVIRQENIKKFIENYFEKVAYYGQTINDKEWAPFTTYCCELYSANIKKLYDRIMNEKHFNIFLNITISIFVSSLMSSWNNIPWLNIVFGLVSIGTLLMISFWAYMTHLSDSVKGVYNSTQGIVEKSDNAFKVFWGKFTKITVQQVSEARIPDTFAFNHSTNNVARKKEIAMVERKCKMLNFGLILGYVLSIIILIGLLTLMICNWVGILN